MHTHTYGKGHHFLGMSQYGDIQSNKYLILCFGSECYSEVYKQMSMQGWT